MPDNIDVNSGSENELSAEELQLLEDEILTGTAGGTQSVNSPNFGCVELD